MAPCTYESVASGQLDSLENRARVTERGVELAPERWADLRFDSDGLAWVLTRSRAFYLNRAGKSVESHWFDMRADAFGEGLARGKAGGKLGFIDRSLDFAIPAAWDFAFPFEGGHAVVCNGCSVVQTPDGEHGSVEGGLWGVIDRTGRIVIPVEHSKDELGKLREATP